LSRLEIDGLLVYEGNFANGVQHGKGSAYGYNGGKVQKLTGEWREGKFVGEAERPSLGRMKVL